MCCYGGGPVRRLYLTTSGNAWAGRRAIWLKHASTAEGTLQRAQRRVAKLEARLVERGCRRRSDRPGGWRRPKHCRRDWFERALAELSEGIGRANEAWLRDPFLQRLFPELRGCA